MDDEQLSETIARAQARDPAAFDRLVDAYATRLYGYFYRLTGQRADAEDLLQELYVRLVRTIGRYEHNGRFESWLFRIAANLSRDRFRRRRSGWEVGMEVADREPDRQAADDDQPDRQLEKDEQRDRLQAAIEQLPEVEREVILLRHFAEMSFKEIAEMMNTPLGTALARAHRGLGRLRDMLGEPTDKLI